ncbi:MAG: site-specific integrase [Candidatus Paceibacterota bacterium]|jgi:integrase
MQEKILWNSVRKIPEMFSEEEIELIFNQIKNSKDYWTGKESNRFKNGHGLKDWAEFFRARDYTLIATIYILGCRPNEACSLKFSDFNLRTMTVKLGGKGINKTSKERVIPVPRRLMIIYEDYFKFPKHRFWKGSRYLFPSFGRDHIAPGTLKRIMREKVLKPLGLWNLDRQSKAQYRTLYKLRHSRASHILDKQIREIGKPDLFAIANFLGHSDIRSTTVYLHTGENYREYLRGQIEI